MVQVVMDLDSALFRLVYNNDMILSYSRLT